MHLLGVASRKVPRKSLRLHPSCSGAIAAAVANAPTNHVRAGQMCVFRPGQSLRLSAEASAVVALRRTGASARAAAHAIFNGLISADHSIRATIIRALLARPDPFSIRMASNISEPSTLAV